ncbi:hypothetical protein C367_04799 [Cryptococcus neoformans Ze90-1]|nr:hypothetical protein C367_04799 [Cryptococcus neoformans var. grubii Ze90-1]
MIGRSVFPWLYTISRRHAHRFQGRYLSIIHASLPSISENPTHLPQLQITFPVLCGRYNRGRAVAFHIYRFCRNRAIIHPAFQRPLSLDTSPVSSLGPLAG